jgi:hypothetical protein
MNKRVIGLTMSLILFFIVGCTSQSLQQANQSVALEGAEQVQARIEMGAGELNVNGGANDLAETTFVYSDANEKPEIDYTVKNNEGDLIIKQPDNVSIGVNEQNSWQIDLNDTVPLDLAISLGAGKSNLKLGNLTLNRLDVNAGASDLELDLRGDWQHDVTAQIEGGVGQLTLYLPQDVGVRIHADQGIGSIHTQGLQENGRAYVNDSYGVSDVTLDLNVEAGLGEINLFVES